MPLKNRYPILSSSANSDKLSLTVQSLVPLIVLLTATFKLDIDNTTVETTILTIASVINGLVFLYGIGRKIYYRLK